jgi:tetratricopeptide (TPR) repeat protein
LNVAGAQRDTRETALRALCYNVIAMPSRIVRFGLVVLAAGACVVLFARRGAYAQSAGVARSAPAESHPDTILIFPFANDTKMANLDWLGEGMSELTEERLEDRGVNTLSREDRTAVLEHLGLPDSARFSHAMMVKIAGEADADAIVYGRYASDGRTTTLEARVLRLSPPSLSPSLTESGPMQDLARSHARLTSQILCALAETRCPPQGASRDESSFSEPPPALRLDALENFIRGVTAMQDEDRLRLLRESARLESDWDRPAFELGQIYFERRDCDSALVWYSRVPPNRPDGPVASFATGVCHLARNDAARADAAFSGLLDRSRKTGEKDALPELPEARNNLGVAELRLGKWPEAEKEFDRAAALEPDEADYWVNVALTKLIEKNPNGAVAPLQSARKIDPDDKEARALLIAALESLGRGQEVAEVRAEVPDDTEKPGPQVNVQDPAALARLARVVRNLDRALLRPTGESSEGQAAPGRPSRKALTGGGQP